MARVEGLEGESGGGAMLKPLEKAVKSALQKFPAVSEKTLFILVSKTLEFMSAGQSEVEARRAAWNHVTVLRSEIPSYTVALSSALKELETLREKVLETTPATGGTKSKENFALRKALLKVPPEEAYRQTARRLGEDPDEPLYGKGAADGR